VEFLGASWLPLETLDLAEKERMGRIAIHRPKDAFALYSSRGQAGLHAESDNPTSTVTENHRLELS
jgi:hypothetical protein